MKDVGSGESKKIEVMNHRWDNVSLIESTNLVDGAFIQSAKPSPSLFESGMCSVM